MKHEDCDSADVLNVQCILEDRKEDHRMQGVVGHLISVKSGVATQMGV